MAFKLTDQQLKAFKTYKHVAPKTTMETFYVEKALVPLENLYPSYISANSMTLIGQLPAFLIVPYIWSHSMKMSDPLPSYVYTLLAFVIQWFSIHDCMDGMRARNRKCGSPLGRIIDEGIDQATYACFGLFIGYLIQLEPGFWLFSIAFINVPFYAMEIRHIFFKDISMIIGEMGPVEVELLYSLFFFFTGQFFGIESFGNDLAYLTGFDNEMLRMITIRKVIASISIICCAAFICDNLKDSFQKNAQETIRLMIPVFILLVISYFCSYLPSASQEIVVVYFLYQMVFAIIILELMLFNMTGKPFSIIQPQYIYLLIPVLCYYTFGIEPELEIFMTRACAACAFIEFFLRIYVLARQYIQHEQIYFFTIKGSRD